MPVYYSSKTGRRDAMSRFDMRNKWAGMWEFLSNISPPACATTVITVHSKAPHSHASSLLFLHIPTCGNPAYVHMRSPAGTDVLQHGPKQRPVFLTDRGGRWSVVGGGPVSIQLERGQVQKTRRTDTESFNHERAVELMSYVVACRRMSPRSVKASCIRR